MLPIEITRDQATTYEQELYPIVEIIQTFTHQYRQSGVLNILNGRIALLTPDPETQEEFDQENFTIRFRKVAVMIRALLIGEPCFGANNLIPEMMLTSTSATEVLNKLASLEENVGISWDEANYHDQISSEASVLSLEYVLGSNIPTQEIATDPDGNTTYQIPSDLELFSFNNNSVNINSISFNLPQTICINVMQNGQSVVYNFDVENIPPEATRFLKEITAKLIEHRDRKEIEATHSAILELRNEFDECFRYQSIVEFENAEAGNQLLPEQSAYVEAIKSYRNTIDNLLNLTEWENYRKIRPREEIRAMINRFSVSIRAFALKVPSDQCIFPRAIIQNAIMFTEDGQPQHFTPNFESIKNQLKEIEILHASLDTYSKSDDEIILLGFTYYFLNILNHLNLEDETCVDIGIGKLIINIGDWITRLRVKHRTNILAVGFPFIKGALSLPSTDIKLITQHGKNKVEIAVAIGGSSKHFTIALDPYGNLIKKETIIGTLSPSSRIGHSDLSTFSEYDLHNIPETVQVIDYTARGIEQISQELNLLGVQLIKN